MKRDMILQLTTTFEGHAQHAESGVEYWLARDLQHLLGYANWVNFEGVIKRAQGIIVHKHLPGTISQCERQVQIGSGASRNVVDYQIDSHALRVIEEIARSFKLTNTYSIRNETIVLQLLEKYCFRRKISFAHQFRIGNSIYDCVVGDSLIVEFDEPHHSNDRRQRENDAKKDDLAVAHGYTMFRVKIDMDIIDIIVAVQERMLGQRNDQVTGLRDPSPASFEGNPREIEESIRSKGDQALFGKTTQAMKARWKVPDGRPLADFAPTIILKAKDFATEITIFNARAHGLETEHAISNEHVTNNEAVRKTLIDRGIRPEHLPPAEDVKKVERRLANEDKKALGDPPSLESQEGSDG